MLDPKLDTLLLVAEKKNFTRAAQALSLTQPAVSHHISQLEQELGVRLFVRGNGDLMLTPEGETVLRYVRRMKALEKKMAEGKDVILEIEIQGALKVKKRFPDALLIFVTPPSAGELRRRLVGRGTETIEVINARLRRAAEEASGMEAYDYLLINDEIDACVEQMHQLITLQHSKTCYHLDFLSRMREELYHLDDRQ